MCSLCALTNRYQQLKKSNLLAFDTKHLATQITKKQAKTTQVILLKGRSLKVEQENNLE
ncbi:hypothetical protein Sta7437_2177 [Stanieria cyanosphaera PCC 7437]|uniref:Uncharacterized protein n=1 Tax=Stanieria cyanosphaera (strain ATCC 29371 / PCC 7437) TaxID=111780 RepID=K9XUH0_STAC7|nr:hypothetical protein [Stanieria cyanosphaera]AFZ35726.1 hypothetical protein Sta7437_2177 [Stanieria cyanosphaera PCC 7437]